MVSLTMIIYLLFLVFYIIYFARVVYKNYQKEFPLRYGQNETIATIITLCIVTGQFLIPSTEKRLIILLIFFSLFLLLYTIIGFHNQMNHSGELFRFFQKEIRREKICIGIGIGLLLITLLLVHFMD